MLLLVDAQPKADAADQASRHPEGRACGPIVVVNKIDKPGAPDWVIEPGVRLFDKLGATDAQLDFPIIYASDDQRLRRATGRARRAI